MIEITINGQVFKATKNEVRDYNDIIMFIRMKDMEGAQKRADILMRSAPNAMSSARRKLVVAAMGLVSVIQYL